MKSLSINNNNEENDKYSENLLFNGETYMKTLKGQQQLDIFALRRKMVYVYTTKGYGVKAYQDYMLKKNPN